MWGLSLSMFDLNSTVWVLTLRRVITLCASCQIFCLWWVKGAIQSAAEYMWNVLQGGVLRDALSFLRLFHCLMRMEWTDWILKFIIHSCHKPSGSLLNISWLVILFDHFFQSWSFLKDIYWWFQSIKCHALMLGRISPSLPFMDSVHSGQALTSCHLRFQPPKWLDMT